LAVTVNVVCWPGWRAKLWGETTNWKNADEDGFDPPPLPGFPLPPPHPVNTEAEIKESNEMSDQTIYPGD